MRTVGKFDIGTFITNGIRDDSQLEVILDKNVIVRDRIARAPDRLAKRPGDKYCGYMQFVVHPGEENLENTESFLLYFCLPESGDLKGPKRQIFYDAIHEIIFEGTSYVKRA